MSQTTRLYLAMNACINSSQSDGYERLLDESTIYIAYKLVGIEIKRLADACSQDHRVESERSTQICMLDQSYCSAVRPLSEERVIAFRRSH